MQPTPLTARVRASIARTWLVPALLLAACAEFGTPTEPAKRPLINPGTLDATPVAAGPRVRISQVYGGGGTLYTHDFVELYNSGDEPQDLSAWSIQYASATGTGTFSQNPVTTLTGTIQPGQHYLVRMASPGPGAPALPTPDATGSVNLSATGGKVVLVKQTTGVPCNGGSTPCTVAQRALFEDLVGYGPSANFFEGSGPTPATGTLLAAVRKANGATDTDDNAADFVAATPNPRNSAGRNPAVSQTIPATGSTNVAVGSNVTITFNRAVNVADGWYTIVCADNVPRTATVTGGPTTYVLDPSVDFAVGSCTVTVVADKVTDAAPPNLAMLADAVITFTTAAGSQCTNTFTPIAAIQGNGNASPLVGQAVVTEGVVTFVASNGYYLQSETNDPDPATSEGIFVFTSSAPTVAIGQVVSVAGSVAEFQGLTEIVSPSTRQCGRTTTVAPADVTLPLPTDTHLERFEAMLVRLPQTLTVTEHFQLGRYGQVVVSSGGRLAQPTNVAAPGAPALALQAQNNLNRLVLDDQFNNQNPDPIVFGRGGNPLTASNTLRGGDQVTGVVGVMTYDGIPLGFRVRPVGALGGGIPVFQPANARPSSAPSVGGSLRVATFNLLNYFNTFAGCTTGVGGGATDCRGANNATEFQRQRAKTLAAIAKLGADVIVVNELENDGYGASSAIQDLVAGMGGTWAFVNADAATGQVNALGTDAIKVGILYRTDRVTPVGTTAALNNSAFVNGGDGAARNRPALAQAFETPQRGRFVVVANHLKSKGSACDIADQGDGQGDCNVVRTQAALLLRDWLAGDPTGTGETDVLIAGDLNSYAMEDPITVLRNAGYTNLIPAFQGASAYSYVFDGQWGSLDHVLASASMLPQVTGAADYHINADEPSVLDYNTEFKTVGQQASLYAADEFRTSDHDPVVVGLSLVASPAPYTFTGPLWPVTVVNGAITANPGAILPFRFSLGGNFGLGVLVGGAPTHRPVNCVDRAPLGAWANATGGPLTFAPANNTYGWNWTTLAAWTGSCREFRLRLNDGSERVFLVRFR